MPLLGDSHDAAGARVGRGNAARPADAPRCRSYHLYAAGQAGGLPTTVVRVRKAAVLATRPPGAGTRHRGTRGRPRQHQGTEAGLHFARSACGTQPNRVVSTRGASAPGGDHAIRLSAASASRIYGVRISSAAQPTKLTWPLPSSVGRDGPHQRRLSRVDADLYVRRMGGGDDDYGDNDSDGDCDGSDAHVLSPNDGGGGGGVDDGARCRGPRPQRRGHGRR
jgi:hypothetical protein